MPTVFVETVLLRKDVVYTLHYHSYTITSYYFYTTTHHPYLQSQLDISICHMSNLSVLI